MRNFVYPGRCHLCRRSRTASICTAGVPTSAVHSLCFLCFHVYPSAFTWLHSAQFEMFLGDISNRIWIWCYLASSASALVKLWPLTWISKCFLHTCTQVSKFAGNYRISRKLKSVNSFDVFESWGGAWHEAIPSRSLQDWLAKLQSIPATAMDILRSALQTHVLSDSLSSIWFHQVDQEGHSCRTLYMR